jgi:predicted Zn-dependent protease
VELFNPNSATATDIENWSASNGGGSDEGNMLEMNDGTSQAQTFASLPTGVDQLDTDYSGANGSGTATSVIYDWTAGGSQQQITLGLPSGESELINNYAGADQTGGETTSITDYTAGNSLLDEFNVGGNIANVLASFSGLNATGTDEQNTLNFTNGASQSENMTGLPSGTIETITGYAGANLSGSENYNIDDYSNNNSTMELLNPSSGVNNIYQFFGDLNAVGTPNSAIIYNANNTSVDVTYDFDGNPNATKDTFFQGTTNLGYGYYSIGGQYIGGIYNGESSSDFSSDGGVIVADGGINLNDGGSQFDDGGFELTPTTKPNSPTIADIALANVGQGSPAAVAAAQAAQNEISFVAQLAVTDPSSVNQSFYEGAKWNGTVITWSLADSAGASGSPFSSYMGTQYKALVTAAFAEWGAASGITFEQVADSSESDIRLGFGDFDTSASGVLGYTSLQTQDGQIQSGVTIRLEDPSQDALLTSLTGALSYSSTQSSLYQTILHEIGHALGLADNADPNSVMYYGASNNISLDSTDIAGIQAMYGPNATLSFALPVSDATLESQIQQLTQATAAFQSQQSAGAAFVPPEISVVPTSLAVSQHA